MRFVTRFLPADMEPVLAAFSRTNIFSAGPDVVLHAYGFVGLPKLDLAIVRHHHFTFVFTFSFAFVTFEVVVFDDGLGGRCCRGT